MKTSIVNHSSGTKGWDGNKGKLKQFFARLTGYDIMFEESRKDLRPDKNLAVLEKAKKRMAQIEKMNFITWKC